MRKLAYFMMLVIGAVTIISCNDDETYADQKERERNAIAKFVSDSAIHVISEEEFAKRKEAYVAHEPKVKEGWLLRYSKLVDTSAKGAIMKK